MENSLAQKIIHQSTMKKHFLLAILLSLFALLLSGCSLTNTKNKDLAFDIDLSSLNYELPNYTKLCIPEIQRFCWKNECKKIKPTVFTLYDKNSQTLYRCDKKPCDAYVVNEYSSGIFTYLTPKDGTQMSMKIADDPSINTMNPEMRKMKNEYTEILNLWMDVFISNGKCVDK